MHDITDPTGPPAQTTLRSALRGTLSRSLGRSLGVVAGWAVLILGVALLPLPGPGSLVILAGVRILVPHHAWAARIHDETRLRLVQATAAGVATWPRVALSALGPLWLAGLTLAYAADLQVGALSVVGLGPDLPFRSPATTVGLAVSALATAALVLVAVQRWGPHQLSAVEPAQAATKQAPARTGRRLCSRLQLCS